MKTIKILLFVFTLFISGISIINADSGSGSVVVRVNVVPTVTSPTVSSITTGGATLGANVTSLGYPASISARGTCWGTSTNPTTNCASAGGTTTGTFSHTRTGMSCGTTYYYRGYATNSTGTGYSASGTITTSACPTPYPAPTGFTATPGACGSTTLTLSWNAVSGASTYQLFRTGVGTPIYTG